MPLVPLANNFKYYFTVGRCFCCGGNFFSFEAPIDRLSVKLLKYVYMNDIILPKNMKGIMNKNLIDYALIYHIYRKKFRIIIVKFWLAIT